MYRLLRRWSCGLCGGQIPGRLLESIHTMQFHTHPKVVQCPRFAWTKRQAKESQCWNQVCLCKKMAIFESESQGQSNNNNIALTIAMTNAPSQTCTVSFGLLRLQVLRIEILWNDIGSAVANYLILSRVPSERRVGSSKNQYSSRLTYKQLVFTSKYEIDHSFLPNCRQCKTRKEKWRSIKGYITTSLGPKRLDQYPPGPTTSYTAG